jgi:hypothetical protein
VNARHGTKKKARGDVDHATESCGMPDNRSRRGDFISRQNACTRRYWASIFVPAF